MTAICIALTPRTTDDALRLMNEHAAAADLFELRLDAMHECDLPAIVKARPKPVIVTNRSADQGGFRQQNDAERLETLAEAVRLGAEHIDVELTHLAVFEELMPPEQRGETRLIASFHDTVAMPEDLPVRAAQIAATSADVVKVVGTARRVEDNLPVFEALRQATKPTIALAMGPEGEMSRILAGKFGAYLTFASTGEGSESAPGQVDERAMRTLYRADRVGPATKVYAVMGNPVGHSLSPAIHNAAFANHDIDAVYIRMRVDDDPAETVRAFGAVPIDGYSVTIPHKESVMAACVSVDELSRRMRAVNTLVRREDGYHATNTDVTSAMKVLAQALGTNDFTGKRALVLGAGGVGRAYVHGLLSRGAAVTVTDLDAARRNELATETGATAASPREVAAAEADVLMNASPVGMWPKVDATPIDASRLKQGMVVFDAVYNPRQTRLLREAAAAGCVTISGVEQFVGQAAEQFELWTGIAAPVEKMRQVVLDALAEQP